MTEVTLDGLAQELAALKNSAQKILVVPKEKTIRVFSGVGQPSVEEFEREIKSVWASRGLEATQADTKEKVEIIISHVTSYVRSEILCRSAEDRRDPDKVLGILHEVWGEQRSVSQLLGSFYAVTQRGYESVREFSHRLNKAFSDVLKRQEEETEQTPLSSKILRDHFIAGLTSSQLRRCLKAHVHKNPRSTFLEVRDEALRWMEEEEQVDSTEAVSAQAEVSARQLQAMEAIVEKLAKMETRMGQLEQQVGNGGPQGGQRASGWPRNRPRLPFSSDGRPICLGCNSPGHIKRNCPNGSRQGNDRPQ